MQAYVMNGDNMPPDWNWFNLYAEKCWEKSQRPYPCCRCSFMFFQKEVKIERKHSFILFLSSDYPYKLYIDIIARYYCKVASSNTSRLEAHAGFFELLIKGIFDLYVL